MEEETVNAILVDADHRSPESSIGTVVEGMLEVSAPHHRALLGLLATSKLHGLDVEPLVVGLSDELTGLAGSQMFAFAGKLKANDDIIRAIDEVPSVLPPSCQMAIRIAHKNGTEDLLYDEISNRLPEFDQTLINSQSNYSKLLRVSGKVFFVISIISFLMLKIVPEFQKIMEEFGVDPSPPFVLLLTISDYIAKLWFVFPILILLTIFFTLPSLRRYFSRWNPMTWRQKLYSPSIDRRRSLALATRKDRSLSEGIDMILECKPTKKISKKLGSAKARMQTGEEQWQALASERVISNREAKALSMSVGEDTQNWLLRWSAKTQIDNEGLREDRVVRAIVLLTNMGLAFFVLLSAVAVFTTLIDLIGWANHEI